MKMFSFTKFKNTIAAGFIASLVLISSQLNSQSLSSNTAWNKALTANKSFIENKGQFTLDGSDRKEVLFSVDHSNLKVYFTKKGIVYKLIKPKIKTEKEREREEEYEEAMKRSIKTAEEFKAFEAEEHRIKSTNETVNMLWNEPNENVEIIGVNPKNDYHSYNYVQAGGTLKNVNYVKGYEKIVYKNIYPFIDIEYVFAEKGGLKYSITLHPGANPAQIKMIYDKHVDLKNNGDVSIDTKVGDIIDHAPLTFYSHDNSNIVTSSFKVEGKSVSFNLGTYDNSKTIVIDPWTQTPAFVSNWDCVWECEKDGAGNVYIIGGVNKMQLIKYNAGGVLQWTYNTPYDTSAWLGTFATDNAGNSYVTQGSTAQIQKVSTAGALVWNNGSPSSQLSAEFWNITFNCDQSRLVVGGTGGSIPPVPYIYQIDVNTGNVVSSLQVTPGNLFPTQEVRSICSSGNGKYYFLTHDSVGYINQNFSICGPNSSAMKKGNSGYSLSYKCENFRYNNSGIMAIRSSGTFFYTHRGDRIDKRSLTTLAIISSAPIPGGVFSGSAVQNSGIDIDACGNVYVGSKNQVIKFDANLTQLATFPTSSPFNVYDVHVSTAGDIIVAGSTGTSATAARTGFIQSIAAGACNTMSLICCDPSICIPPKKCVTDPPFTFTVSTPGGTWSGTGVNASGVFSPATAGIGTHTVVYSLACGSETVLVTVSSCTLSICQNSGSLVVSGGTPTYTWTSLTTSLSCAACAFGCNFLCPGTQVPVWSTTGSTVTAPTGTVFPIRVQDAGGTTYTISNLASVPSCSTSCPTLTVSIPTQTNVNCFGASTGTAAATTIGGVGAYTYTWMPGNLIGASQTGLAAGIYTVNVKDANNCPGTKTLSITQPTSALSVSVTNTASQTCVQSGSATVNAFGGTSGYTYTWSPSGGNASSATGLIGGSYTVSVTDSKGCLTNTVVTIPQNTLAPSIIASVGGSLTCTTTSVVLIETSSATGVTYLWQPMNVTTSTVAVTAVGNYSLTVTNTLTGCTNNTVLTVSSNTIAPNVTTSVPGTITCTNPSVIISGASTTGGVTYSWMPGNITTSSISATAAGNYSLTVTNPVNGCTSSTVVAVTQNTVLPNVTALGGGTITCSTTAVVLTGSSITPGVTFTWQPMNVNTSTASATAAGNYTVSVTNPSNGCINSATVAVTQNTLLPNISATVSGSLTCTTNTVSLNGASTTTGATFTWQPMNVNTSSAVASSSGNYTLSVTDPLNGCINSTVVAVIQAAGVPTVAANASNNLNCANASATLNATSAGNTIVWNGGSLVNAANPSTINTAGSYTVTATNALSGCTSSLVIAVTQNTTAPNSSIAPPAVLNCTNTSVIVTGGSTTGGVTYNWLPGNITTTTLSVNTVGNYSLTVTDPANSCTSTAVVAVTQNTVVPNLTASVGGTLTCISNAVTLTGNSSTAGVNYLWQPGSITTSTNSATASGNYSLTVTDPANGCTSSTVVAVTQNTVAPNVSATVGGTLTCSSNTVNLTGASTTPGATFTWQPVNLNTANISVSAAGNFTLLVEDPINGCISNTVVTVIQNGAFPNISIATPGTLTCTNPSLTLTGNSTTSGVTYSWSPQNVTTATAVVNAPGSYTLSVFDAINGCTSYSMVNVVQIINSPTISIVKSSDINCTNPSVTITASSAGNTLVWNGGSLVNAANPAVVNVAGNYTATATDPVSGCTSSSVVTVNQSSLTPNATIVSSGNLDCNNTVVTLTGSSSTAGVNLQWVGGPSASVYTVSTPGTYTFVVSDPVSGCSTFTTVSVITVASFTANLSATAITCNGNNNGIVNVNLVGGGLSPFQITELNSATTTSNVAAFPFVINGLAAANYSITIMDASGCAQTLTISVTEPAALTSTINGSGGVCAGSPITLNANVQGGTPSYSYLWLPGGGTNSSLTTTPATATTFTLQITDAKGCTSTSTMEVVVQPNPQGGIISQNVIGCAPACNTFSLAQAQFTTNSYQWNFTNTTTGAITSYNGYNPNVCFDVPGIYNLNLGIYSTFGCSVTASYINVMTVNPKPVADFNHSPIKPIINQDPYVTFTDASYGANIVSWNWFFMNTAQYTSIEQNPTFPYTEPGTYPVVLIVKSDKGCIDTIIRPLVVGEDFGIYVPNAFTPNDDGFNDIFFPKGFGIVKYELTIFDRWGEVVFQTKTFEEGWDGRFQGRGKDIMKEDVYTWLIQATSVFGKSHELKGHVTLIR